MKTLKLFALAVAVCGLFAVEANAGGGRRSRGCSNCTTASSCCSGSTCATPAAATKTEAPKAAEQPAKAAEQPAKAVDTKPVEKTVTVSTCSTGTCGSEVVTRSRGLRGCRGGRCR